MKKIGAILLTALLAGGLLAGCGNKTDNTTAEGGNAGGGTIKIGADLELTGGQASFGDSALKGVKLAVKEINDAGGILGKNLN